MRLLPERRDPDRQGVPRPEPARHRRADSAGAVRRAVPLLRQRPDAAAIRRYAHGAARMTSALTLRRAARARSRAGFSRRAFLKGSGALIVTFASAGVADRLERRPGARLQRDREHAARFVDRDRRRRHGHGLHRQVRVRPGPLHRADAARRRGAVRAVRSRAPDPVRHVDDARPGHDVRAAVASDELQPTQPGAGRGDGARDAGAPGVDASRSAAVRISIAEDGAISVKADAVAAASTYGALVGGRKFEVPLDPKATRKHPREWTVLGTPVPRVDMRAMVDRPVRVRAQRARAGHAARPRRAAAVARRDAGERGRELGARHGRAREGRRQEQLRRRRRREAVAGDAGRGEAAGDVDAWRRASRRSATPTSRSGRSRPPTRSLVDSGDVDETLASAATVLRATYHHPYQMHGSIGSSCAVADVQGRQGDDVVGDAVGVSRRATRPR